MEELAPVTDDTASAKATASAEATAPAEVTAPTSGAEPTVPPSTAVRDSAPGAVDGLVMLIPGMGEEGTRRRVFAWIYGLVICAAVLAAASGLPSAWEVAVYVGSSMLVYWGAESYANVLATRTVSRHRPGWEHIREVLTEGWVLVTASFIPTVTLVVSAYVLRFDVEVAIDLALGACVVLLFGAGWNAAVQSGVQGTWRLIFAASIAAAFGLVMAALKYAVH